MLFFHQIPSGIDLPVATPISCSVSAADPKIPKEIPVAIWISCSTKEPVSIDFGDDEIGNLRFFLSIPGRNPEQKRLKIPSLTYPGVVQITPDNPYKRRINLASLEPMPVPDILEISLAIIDPKNERQLFVTNSISVNLLEGRRKEAASWCNKLARAILSRGLSTSQMLEVEDELASVHDPLAIPALTALLDKGFDDITLINGLRAIGTKEARDILFDYAHKRTDPDDAKYALAAIKEMDRVGIRETSPVEPKLTR